MTCVMSIFKRYKSLTVTGTLGRSWALQSYQPQHCVMTSQSVWQFASSSSTGLRFSTFISIMLSCSSDFNIACTEKQHFSFVNLSVQSRAGIVYDPICAFWDFDLM